MSDKALTKLRNRIEHDRDRLYREALILAERSEGDGVDADIDFAVTRLADFDRQLEALPTPAATTKDRPIYGPGSPYSYFRDLAEQAGNGNVPIGPASDRLAHHFRAEGGAYRRRQELASIETRARGIGMNMRADSTAAGAGGEFSPPSFLLDRFASIARSAAPILKAVVNAPLPDDCMEIFVPRVTSAGGIVTTDGENINPPQVWSATDQIEIPVVTFAGTVPISTPLWERGPNLDEYLTRDFAESFAASAEQQIITGTGSGGQCLGLLNLPTSTVDGVPGASVTTYTSSSPTPSGMVTAIGQAAAAVGDTRLRPPDALIMRASRYFWMTTTSEGSATEPTMRPGTGRPPTDKDLGAWGPIAGGLPTYLSAEVPNDLGSGGNQDTIIAARLKDFIWLQGEPKFEALVDTAGGPSQLTVQVVWRCYAAFVSARYPSAVSYLAGTGMTNPTGW